MCVYYVRMDCFLWAKALLLCCRHLKSVIGNIDTAMDTIAKCSGTGARDTYEIMERAADLIARKVRILNLRIITADMLNSLSYDKRRVLDSRYIYNISAKDFSETERISMRGVYRLVNGALAVCAEYLKERNYDNNYFESRYGNEKWIISNLRKHEAREAQAAFSTNQFSRL